MHVRRGLLNWGIFLICLGVVPLAVQLRVIDSATAASLLRLWPLILVGIGLGLLLRFTRAQLLGGFVVAGTFGVLIGVFFAAGFPSFAAACTGDQATGQTQSRNGVASGPFELNVELTCGEMAITRATGAAWSVDVRAGHELPAIDATDNTLEVRSETPEGWYWFLGAEEREQWQVVLPSDINVNANLTVSAGTLNAALGSGSLASVNATYNAADGRLDLSGAGPTSFNATFNASSVALILPSGSFNGNMTLNASSLNVCLPAMPAVRITFHDTLSSHNFAAFGLQQVGDAWQTPGYASATGPRVDLEISANVSSLTLNRYGECK